MNKKSLKSEKSIWENKRETKKSEKYLKFRGKNKLSITSKGRLIMTIKSKKLLYPLSIFFIKHIYCCLLKSNAQKKEGDRKNEYLKKMEDAEKRK